METPATKGAFALAEIMIKMGIAAVGLIGLLIFSATLVTVLPVDVVIARCVSLMMFGWGFGQAECRTLKVSLGLGYQFKGPAWRWTVTGLLLFLIAFGAATYLTAYLLGWQGIQAPIART